MGNLASRRSVPENTGIHLNNKETGPPSLIRGSKSKHVGKLNLHGAVGQDFFFQDSAAAALLLSFFSAPRNFIALGSVSSHATKRTRASQIIRAVRRNGGLSPRDSQSVKKNIRTQKKNRDTFRESRCGFRPLFSELGDIRAGKFFYFPTSAPRPPTRSTPLPLTPARGHPPARASAPAAFDSEFAPQPTAISRLCNEIEGGGGWSWGGSAPFPLSPSSRRDLIRLRRPEPP